MILAMSLSDIMRRLVLPKATPEPEQLTIAHAGDTLPVTFLRSARARRASLRVDSAQRRIVLTAPLRMARGTAVDFAQAQAGWIAARLKRLPELKPFADGAEVPLFGAPHRIRHRADRSGTVWREGLEIHVAGRPEHLPRRLRDWLTAELKGRLVPLVHAKAQRVERHQPRLELRHQPVAHAPRQMLRPAGYMDFRAFPPDGAALVGAVADHMRHAEQRHLGTVAERPSLGQAIESGGNPAGLRLGEVHCRAAGHAQRRRQHDAPVGRIDTQRGAPRPGVAHEGDGQRISGMSNGQLLGLGQRFRQETTEPG